MSTTQAKPTKPKAKVAAPLHPPYIQMITEAISALKERGGSSSTAIGKYLQDKYKTQLPANFKKMLSVQLRRFAKSSKLAKVKNSYKVGAAPATGEKKPVGRPAKKKAAGEKKVAVKKAVKKPAAGEKKAVKKPAAAAKPAKAAKPAAAKKAPKPAKVATPKKVKSLKAAKKSPAAKKAAPKKAAAAKKPAAKKART